MRFIVYDQIRGVIVSEMKRLGNMCKFEICTIIVFTLVETSSGSVNSGYSVDPFVVTPFTILQ